MASFIIRSILVGCVILNVSNTSLGRERSKKVESTPAPVVTLPWSSDRVPETLQYFDKFCREDVHANLVLNELRFGKAALAAGENELAELAFDDAIVRMESIEQNEESAQKAKKLTHAESEKFFKGEPYERSLAYLYRGLLYFQDGDYPNARACFRSGQFFDASRQGMFQGDYLLLYYLEGKCNQLLGEEQAAREIFQRLARTYETLYLKPAVLPSTSNDANCLFLVELGPAPIKYGFGKYNQELGYARNLYAPRPSSCRLIVNKETVAESHEPIEDVFFQAVTRGGRIADSYNRGKAAFKTTTDVIGNVGLVAGTGIMATANNSNDLIVGAGIALLGGLFKGLSSSAKPNADTRYWDNIPEQYHIFVLQADEPFDAEIGYYDKNNNLINTRTLVRVVPDTDRVQLILVQ